MAPSAELVICTKRWLCVLGFCRAKSQKRFLKCSSESLHTRPQRGGGQRGEHLTHRPVTLVTPRGWVAHGVTWATGATGAWRFPWGCVAWGAVPRAPAIEFARARRAPALVVTAEGYRVRAQLRLGQANQAKG